MALRLTNGTSRTRIFQSPLGTVDNLQVFGSQRTTGPSGFSPDFQVCLPYQGVFVWHVAGDDVVGEANQVLYVSGGEAYRISQPTGHGYGELIITPTLRLLSDLACTAERRLSAHPLFVRRSQRANLRLQNLRSRFLHVAMNRNQDGLAAEELLTDLLRNALESQVHQPPLGPATRELVRRTKLFVEACSFSPLRLHDVAQAVGASPAYLTNVFRRAEGSTAHARRYLPPSQPIRPSSSMSTNQRSVPLRALVPAKVKDDKKNGGVMPEVARTAGTNASDIAALLALNDDYIRSVQRSDVQRFREILAEDFLCSLPDGSLVDRATFLEQIAAPARIANLRAHDVNVRVLGDFALVHARTTFTTDGRPGAGRYTDAWARRNGHWVAIAAHVTRS